MTHRPLINEECFIVRSGNWDNTYIRARVVKVTTGGQISVLAANSETPRRFTERGYEVGQANSYHPSYLNFDVAGVEKIMADRAEQKLHDTAVRALLEKINGHKNGLGNYFITPEVKAELQTLLNQI